MTTLQKIANYTYHYSCIGWAKAVTIETILTEWYGSDYLSAEDENLIQTYRQNPTSETGILAMRELFLSRLYEITPEHAPYTDLNDNEWVKVDELVGNKVLREMMETSKREIEEQRKEHLESIQLHLLAPLGLTSLNDPQAKTAENAQKIKDFFNSDSIHFEPDGSMAGMMEDYDALHRQFVHELFEPSSVRYFASAPDAYVEAVIGIDHQVVGIIWMN